MLTAAEDARFFSKVRLTSGGCWEWIAGRTTEGYGKLKLRGRDRTAHSVTYEMFVGPPPTRASGRHLDHTCRNRWCCNHAHLENVTAKVNLLRGDGVGALAARQTHCKRGHEFTDANTRLYRGRRHCRECARQRGSDPDRRAYEYRYRRQRAQDPEHRARHAAYMRARRAKKVES